MAALVPKTNLTTGSATAPTAGALVTGELASNKFTGRLYLKTEAGNSVDASRVTLSGDATGSTATPTTETQAGTISVTLATSGVTAGTYGTASAIPAITVDAKGRVTSITTNASTAITALTGDVTATGSGSQAATLAASGVTAGTYGSSSLLPVIAVDAKGRVTSVTTTSPGLTALTGDVTASGAGSAAATLAASGVTAATYGSATAMPQITVDAKGRITSASTNTLNNSNIATTVSAAKTAAYSLVLTDANTFIPFNLSAAANCTIPLNSTQAFPIGTQILIQQVGTAANQVTIVATGGVTLQSSKTKTYTQWSIVTLIKTATDSWALAGDAA